MRGEVRARRVWDDGGESGMHGEGPTQGSGARALAEHTSNMERMSVTLDVSKLSGWLNAYARCRVERRARAMWGEVCGPGGGKGVYGGGGGSGMHAGRDRLKAWESGHAPSAPGTCTSCFLRWTCRSSAAG